MKLSGIGICSQLFFSLLKKGTYPGGQAGGSMVVQNFGR